MFQKCMSKYHVKGPFAYPNDILGYDFVEKKKFMVRESQGCVSKLHVQITF